MRIVVIGGTGLIGSKLVNRLREHGHEPIAAAPNTGVNTITGEGLAVALKGASVTVDVSSSPDWEDAAVLKFFETSTRNLLSYGAGARGRTSRRLIGCRDAVAFRERLLPGQDCTGEIDRRVFHPVLDRARHAVLRVPQGVGGYLHGR